MFVFNIYLLIGRTKYNTQFNLIFSQEIYPALVLVTSLGPGIPGLECDICYIYLSRSSVKQVLSRQIELMEKQPIKITSEKTDQHLIGRGFCLT